jgi:hypothetical protein
MKWDNIHLVQIHYFSNLLNDPKMCFFSSIPSSSFSNYFGSKVDPRKKKFGISDAEIFGLQNGIKIKILTTRIV